MQKVWVLLLLDCLAHSEGISTIASGIAAHAEGIATRAQGTGAHAEGGANIASGMYSHAEGDPSMLLVMPLTQKVSVL